jgi:glc operon protein GlcG
MKPMPQVLAGALLTMGLTAQASEPVARQMVSLAHADQLASACEAFAKAQAIKVSIAVVDAAGGTILVKRMDQAGFLSTDLAITKARTAAGAGVPSSVLRDAVKGGSLGLLSIQGIATVGGGVPILHGETVIGGIGVSGASEDDDVACATAGFAQ